MKRQFIVLAAFAFAATSAAFGASPTPAGNVAKPEPVPHEQTLVEELARSAREILAAVVPEISLPKVKLELPIERNDAR